MKRELKLVGAYKAFIDLGETNFPKSTTVQGGAFSIGEMVRRMQQGLPIYQRVDDFFTEVEEALPLIKDLTDYDDAQEIITDVVGKLKKENKKLEEQVKKTDTNTETA